MAATLVIRDVTLIDGTGALREINRVVHDGMVYDPAELLAATG